MCQVFSSTPLLPIRSAHPGQIEGVLREVHKNSGGKLQLLIIILPDFKGSYGECWVFN